MSDRKGKKLWSIYVRAIGRDAREYREFALIHSQDIGGAWQRFFGKRPGTTYLELRITEVKDDGERKDQGSKGISGAHPGAEPGDRQEA